MLEKLVFEKISQNHVLILICLQLYNMCYGHLISLQFCSAYLYQEYEDKTEEKTVKTENTPILAVDPVSGVYIGDIEAETEEKYQEDRILTTSKTIRMLTYVGNDNDKQKKIEGENNTFISEKKTFDNREVKLKQREELLKKRNKHIKEDKEMCEDGVGISEEATGERKSSLSSLTEKLGFIKSKIQMSKGNKEWF